MIQTANKPKPLGHTSADKLDKKVLIVNLYQTLIKLTWIAFSQIAEEASIEAGSDQEPLCEKLAKRIALDFADADYDDKEAVKLTLKWKKMLREPDEQTKIENKQETE